MKIRTRIAPSPTGAPHIGTAYIALFNYAFAKNNGGDFILRIEDTDQTRSTPESETAILEALRWVGLPWDEGPDTGGGFGPYRQSERTDIYREHCFRLVEEGKAYPCFCTSERLNDLRRRQEEEKSDRQGYDGLCASIDPQEARRRMDAGEPYVIRLKVPTDGECSFNDELRGAITIPWNTIDDQILLKSDGFPTYHLANVVDDHLMEISHVIRGEEWISSTPKHVLLYEAFGWEAPRFAHLPLLRNPDKSKLSKRKNPTGILYYRRAGFLPEALINFLGLMAYSPADGEEMFSLEKMTEEFNLERVSLGGPIFDFRKLQAFNARYIRNLSSEELLQRMRQWLLNDETLLQLIPLAQPRLDQLTDFIPMTTFVFSDKLEYDYELLLKADEDPARAVQLLRIAQWELEKNTDWNAESIRAVFNRISENENIKFKKLLSIFFVAISGKPVSLPLFDTMKTLGRDMSLRRIQYAVDLLEQNNLGMGKKKLKKLTKDYNSRYHQ